MDLDRARFLVSPEGRAALTAAAAEDYELHPLPLQTALRRMHAPFVASAIAEQLLLGEKAAARFGASPLPLLTGEGLQMMTHPLVAGRRAARLRRVGLPAADLTCGLGGDLSALSHAAVRPVVGVERDGTTALLARANVPLAHVVAGDARQPPLKLKGRAIVLDPSRRARGRRAFDVSTFEPAWEECIRLCGTASAAALKGPPGIDRTSVPAESEVEFVQLGRSLREATLWFGEGARPGVRCAVHLPSGAAVESTDEEETGIADSFGRFVFDPESCVTRAGLVTQLGARLGARRLDPAVAYLTGDRAVTNVLAPCFEVLEVVPFSLARVRSHLRARGWRPDEIRRRAFPIEPDDLRRQLGLSAGTLVTLLCTTVGRKRMVVIGKRNSAENCSGV